MTDLKLLWSDEFNQPQGEAPDSRFWNFDLGDGTEAGIPGWGNQEREWYLAQQARHNGASALVITAERLPDNNEYPAYYGKPAEWASAKITTKGKVEVLYGRVEARIKAPTGAGTWPAFWMLGNDIQEVTWPHCGEIDILEIRGRDTENLVATLHGPGYFGDNGCGLEWRSNVKADADFHTYAIEWLPDRITWFFDDIAFSTKTKDDVAPNKWVFDHPFYVITNLAMGGGFTGEIDPELNEAHLEIDYIRVYSIDDVGQAFIKIS